MLALLFLATGTADFLCKMNTNKFYFFCAGKFFISLKKKTCRWAVWLFFLTIPHQPPTRQIWPVQAIILRYHSLKTSSNLVAEASGWTHDADSIRDRRENRKEPSWVPSEQGSEGKMGLNILT